MKKDILSDIEKEFDKQFGMPEFQGKYIKHATECEEIKLFYRTALIQIVESVCKEVIKAHAQPMDYVEKIGLQGKDAELYNQRKDGWNQCLSETEVLQSSHLQTLITNLKNK